MALTNAQLWNYLRKTNPNFRSHTAEATADLFTEKGFEALKLSDVGALNEFFQLSMRVAFQKLTTSRAKNPLEDSGLVEVYGTPNGGYVQRLAVNSIKPVSPAFRGLEDGDSVDPFIVRKPVADERFFTQNYDYQSFVSVQDYQIKTIFISEFGMADFVAGVMQGLMNGYTIQNYANVLACLNAGINSATYPLQDSQKIVLGSWTDGAPTSAELTAFILQVKDIATMFDVSSQTKAFNALRFETTYNPEDFVLLMRAGIKNRIATALMVGAFNPEQLSIPFAIKEVENFGGLIPLDSNNDALQPIYDRNGTQVAYVSADVTVNGPAHYDKTSKKWIVNVTSGSTTADTNQTVVEPDSWNDPNEDVLAVIAEKGIIFENIQNPYEVRPIYNPRGLYTNYWASSPNNGISYDPLYGVITISKPSN